MTHKASFWQTIPFFAMLPLFFVVVKYDLKNYRLLMGVKNLVLIKKA
jgi:hypothetical protein